MLHECNPVCPGEIGELWRLCLSHTCRNYYSIVFEDQTILHGQFVPHVTMITCVQHVTMTTHVPHVTITTRVPHVTMTTYTCHKRSKFILFKPKLSYYTAKGHEQNPQVVLERITYEVNQGSDGYLTFHIILDYHHPANRCRNQHNTAILSANLSYKIYVELAYFITKYRCD